MYEKLMTYDRILKFLIKTSINFKLENLYNQRPKLKSTWWFLVLFCSRALLLLYSKCVMTSSLVVLSIVLRVCHRYLVLCLRLGMLVVCVRAGCFFAAVLLFGQIYGWQGLFCCIVCCFFCVIWQLRGVLFLMRYDMYSSISQQRCQSREAVLS